MDVVSEISPAEVMTLYQDHPGWRDRELDNVRRAIQNTDLIVGLRDNGNLIASGRVMTDFVYYAKAYDIIVAANRRNEGIGQRLMDEIVSHEALTNMADQHLELVCREGLESFYEKCGFTRFDKTVEVDGEEQEYIKMNYSEFE
ncbi:MAG: GNAT family N-acetyltransferase [Halobacteriaceae archaeon]